MTQIFATCLSEVAPYYNFVFIVVLIILFIRLFGICSKKKDFIRPWRLLFFAILFFVLEEIFIVLRVTGILYTPRVIDSIFGMIIVGYFIWMVLCQREYVKNRKGKI